MENNVLVSVFLVSYYNCELIHDAVKRISQQDYSRMELIVSDDGTVGYSREQMEKDVKPFQHYFERIIINKNQQNEGTVKHLNRVINLANGEIICGIGIDDYFADESVVSNVVKFFHEHEQFDVITSKRYEESTSIVLPTLYIQKMLDQNQDKYRKMMFRITPQICNIGTFYKKSCFEKHGLFPEEFKLVEDAPYLSLLVARGVEIGWMDYVTAIHAAGGVTCKEKRRNIIWAEDRTYLYEKWLPSLLSEKDAYSLRCLKFHAARSRAVTNKTLILCFLKYFDVCIYLFCCLGLSAIKEGFTDIKNIMINHKV